MKKNWLFLAIVALVVGGVVLLLAGKNLRGNYPTGNYDEFAKCLSEKGVSMYGTSWCSHCNNQKKAFGGSFQYVNYVECTENEDLCNEKGITGYPTWIIDGKQYSGGQTFSRLSELTGCG